MNAITADLLSYNSVAFEVDQAKAGFIFSGDVRYETHQHV